MFLIYIASYYCCRPLETDIHNRSWSLQDPTKGILCEISCRAESRAQAKVWLGLGLSQILILTHDTERRLKSWCFSTVVLEKTLESPLECKEIKPINPRGNQSWIFIGRTDAKAETPILWPPYAKSWLIGKDSDAGRDWGQEEKGTTEDEMVGWHHRLNGHEFGWTLGVGDGQGGLACCGSWGCKESDMTERLNWTDLTELGHNFPSKEQVSFNFMAAITICSDFQFSSVQSLSSVRLYGPMNHSTPGLPVHHQLQSSLRLMSIESVMPLSHLILGRPLLLLPPNPPSIKVFSNESTLRMRYMSLIYNNSVCFDILTF